VTDDNRAAPAVMPIAILLGTISSAVDDPLHDLVRAARTGDAAAFSEVIDRVRLLAPDTWPDVRSAVVAGVPGHRPGPANRLVLAVAEELAGARGWSHARDALRRIRPAPEAKAGGTRDARKEAHTLAWAPAIGGGAIVLVDDVVRSETTLDACAAAIRAASDHRPVVAVAVARSAVAGRSQPDGEREPVSRVVRRRPPRALRPR
jgi:predicted amidophosphoribosyltransferase